MNLIFKEFQGEHITYLEWKFISDEKDLQYLINSYSITDDYEPIAIDMCGDIIAIKNNYIVIINHEEPYPENDYLLTNEFDKLKILLQKLISIKDFEGVEDLVELKKIKKEIIECKKIAPKKLKENFQEIIDDIDFEIELI